MDNTLSGCLTRYGAPRQEIINDAITHTSNECNSKSQKQNLISERKY